MESRDLTLVAVIDKTYQEVRTESEESQRDKGDCLANDFVSVLPEVVHLDLDQNDLSELEQIWGQWGAAKKSEFTKKYGDIALLFSVKIDEQLIRAMVQFWDPSYRCFTLNQEDMTPTIEEYSTLLRIESANPNKIYWKEQKTASYRKKLSKIMGVDIPAEGAHVRKKGSSNCIPWVFLRDYIKSNLEDTRAMDVFALAIYGLVLFPKVLGHVEVAVVDLFERLDKQINPAPAILAETIRSLNYCRRKGEGRFTGCAQLLYIWVQSHFWGKTDKPMCSRLKSCVPIKEFNKREWSKKGNKKQWIKTLRHLAKEDITWMAPWMSFGSILYSCGGKPWVPLLGIWGAVSYAPLLVRRQYGSEQFIPMTHGLNLTEFAYGEPGYVGRVREIIKAWREIRQSGVGRFSDNITLGYQIWRAKRVHDIVIPPEDIFIRPVSLQPESVMLSEVEIARQEFTIEKGKMKQENQKLQEEIKDLKIKLEV